MVFRFRSTSAHNCSLGPERGRRFPVLIKRCARYVPGQMFSQMGNYPKLPFKLPISCPADEVRTLERDGMRYIVLMLFQLY